MDAPRIERLEVGAFTVPTDQPESDGTLVWDSTTCVVVHAYSGAQVGLGYTYAGPSSAALIQAQLADVVVGHDALKVGEAWAAMIAAIRNLGWPGVASTAISAVDIALWDLKARLLGVPLVALLDGFRDRVPVYGSGGFTSYTEAQLCGQLAGWTAGGIPRVKMKVGRCPDRDPARVAGARDAIGGGCELYVDANGAYTRKQALLLADRFWESGVSWYEEPVSSDDLEGLRLLRDRGPAGMDVAAGEYGYDLPYFRRMLEAGAVDCLQADVTRCGGLTGFLRVAALCDARGLELSTHTAPQLSVHACCGVWHLRHLEYCHDHVRLERLLFDGVLEPDDGALVPDRSRPGHGLELKRADAQTYAA